MKSTLSKLVLAVGIAAALSGCLEEKVPEPTADNCAPDMYEKNLASLSKEANRNEFTSACDSFLKAKKMTKWKFEKSPEDKY